MTNSAKVLHLDFETRSAVNLKDVGLDRYLQHESTGIWCASYCFDDGPIKSWVPMYGPQCPTEIADHILTDGIVAGHNVNFERNIINHVGPAYGFPYLPIEQTDCTMARAYAMGLPGKLEKAGAAVGIELGKDMEGSKVMMKMAKPKKVHADGTIEWHYELIDRLVEYCERDVHVERELDKVLRPLQPAEQKFWFIDQRQNDEGIAIDMRAAKKAMEVVEAETERLDFMMKANTNGEVSSCRDRHLIVVLRERYGVDTDSIAKDKVAALLKSDIPEDAKKLLRLRQESAKSSTAKLKKMIAFAGPDSRIRNLVQFHGASTGRDAGRGIQPQNFPRATHDAGVIQHAFDLFHSDREADHIADLLREQGQPLDIISSALRGFIWSDRGALVAMDWSAIEARVIGWLAKEEKLLKLFREGEDVYKHAAASIYRVNAGKVTKDQRQVGKVAVLALGYQGGVGAFQQMARGYGVKVTDAEADDIKIAWRQAHPNIVNLWKTLESAALGAVMHPGRVFRAGRIAYKVSGSFLMCRLPSGRIMYYPYPKVGYAETPWGDKKATVIHKWENSQTRKWEERSLYGGMLAENVTQAVARDILRDAVIEAAKQGLSVVMRVHDEIVVEAESDEAQATFKKLHKILTTNPVWADGLPLSAEGWVSKRYRK